MESRIVRIPGNYEMVTVNSCEVREITLNPAEPLDLSKKSQLKSVQDIPIGEINLSSDENRNEPLKKYMNKNNKCLSNLTQEMSITLRQSIACLDDICMKAFQCISEMEENDRKYKNAKEYALDFPPLENIEALLPFEYNNSNDLSQNGAEEDEELQEPKETQSEMVLADEIIHKSIVRLNEICQDFKTSYIKNVESQMDIETPKKALMKKSSILVPEISDLSVEHGKYLVEERLTASKRQTKLALNEKSIFNDENMKFLLPEKPIFHDEKSVEAEEKSKPKRKLLSCKVSKRDVSKKSKKTLMPADTVSKRESCPDKVNALSTPRSSRKLKEKSSKVSGVLKPHQTRTDPSCKVNKSKCNVTNCKCGVEVKSYGTDYAQKAQMHWIKKASEQRIRPPFMDILDDIKEKDVERFQSEYPRKDHIMPLNRKCVQDTLVYKLVFDKTLNIWDFLMQNQIKKLKMGDDGLCRKTKSLPPVKKSSSQVNKKEQPPLKKSAGSHSGIVNKSSQMVIAKKSKTKSKKTVTTKIPLEPQTQSQKEMLMPKKHLYTILPIKLIYDQDSTTNIYQTTIKEKLKKYMFDPDLQRNDTYTVLPVFVDHNNAKSCLYTYINNPDTKYDNNVSALPVLVQKQVSLNNQSYFFDEKIQVNTKLCKKFPKETMLGRGPHDKVLWQNKYRKTPAEDIMKITKSRQQQIPTNQKKTNPILINKTIPDRLNAKPPSPKTKGGKPKTPEYKPMHTPPVKENRNTHKTPKLKPICQIETKAISTAVNDIEAKLVEILENPIENKLQAFTSVEEDISKVIERIKTHSLYESKSGIKNEAPIDESVSNDNTLDEVESKIMESVEEFHFADEYIKNETEESETKEIFRLDDHLGEIFGTDSRTDTIEMEKRIGSFLGSIKEETSDSISRENMQKKQSKNIINVNITPNKDVSTVDSPNKSVVKKKSSAHKHQHKAIIPNKEPEKQVEESKLPDNIKTKEIDIKDTDIKETDSKEYGSKLFKSINGSSKFEDCNTPKREVAETAVSVQNFLELNMGIEKEIQCEQSISWNVKEQKSTETQANETKIETQNVETSMSKERLTKIEQDIFKAQQKQLKVQKKETVEKQINNEDDDPKTDEIELPVHDLNKKIHQPEKKPRQTNKKAREKSRCLCDKCRIKQKEMNMKNKTQSAIDSNIDGDHVINKNIKQRSKSFNFPADKMEKILIEQNIGENSTAICNKVKDDIKEKEIICKNIYNFKQSHKSAGQLQTKVSYLPKKAKEAKQLTKNESDINMSTSNESNFEPEFIDSDKPIKQFNSYESNSDILTFLDNLKKITCDHIAVTKHLARNYLINEPFEQSTEEEIIELYHCVKTTKSIPPFLKDISEVSYAETDLLPRALDLERKEGTDLNNLANEYIKGLINQQEKEKICKEICEEIVNDSIDHYRSTCSQTDICTHHIDALIKWKYLKKPLSISESSLISSVMDDLPKIIRSLSGQIPQEYITRSLKNSKALIVKVNSIEKLEELVNASLTMTGKLNTAKSMFLPLMYGILFSVVYLSLNFTFTCG